MTPTDTESVYSSNSTVRKEFEYDSLDMNSRGKLRDIYTNPAINTAKVRGNNNRLDNKDDYEVGAKLIYYK